VKCYLILYKAWLGCVNHQEHFGGIAYEGLNVHQGIHGW